MHVSNTWKFRCMEIDRLVKYGPNGLIKSVPFGSVSPEGISILSVVSSFNFLFI